MRDAPAGSFLDTPQTQPVRSESVAVGRDRGAALADPVVAPQLAGYMLRFGDVAAGHRADSAVGAIHSVDDGVAGRAGMFESGSWSHKKACATHSRALTVFPLDFIIARRAQRTCKHDWRGL